MQNFTVEAKAILEFVDRKIAVILLFPGATLLYDLKTTACFTENGTSFISLKTCPFLVCSKYLKMF